MANVVIVHGSEGHPEENWFPWLKEELEKEGHMVFVPQFPGGEEQNLEAWMEVFKKYDSYLGENTLFVGHSLGATFILSLLEEHKGKAAFLVSGFIGKIGKEYNETTKTFAQKKFNWKTIRDNCTNFYIVHGDDDPIVEKEKAEELKNETGGELKIIESGGHFNEAAGYYHFDFLFEKMKEYL